MKRTSWILLFIGMCASVAMAEPTTQYYSRLSAGSTITLDHQTVVGIELRANPSTGYGWRTSIPPGDNIRILGSSYKPDEPGMIGGGGVTTIYVVAAETGTSDLVMQYRGPYSQGDASVAAADDTVRFSFQTEGAFSETFTVPPAPAGPARLAVQANTYADSDLPDAFNWCDLNGCTPIRSQGKCGACWAFSTVAALESLIKINDGYDTDLSEQYLLQCNTENYNCDGGMWAHSYHQWKRPSGQSEAGAVLESDLPYAAKKRRCGSDHSKAYKIDSWKYVCGSQSCRPSTRQIKKAIYEHGPVSVGLCVNDEFIDYEGGVFSGPSCSELNHAVSLTGWNDEDGGYWIMRNSWGSDWGEDGYMRIGYGVSSIGTNANYVVYGDDPDPNKTPTPTPTPTPDPDLVVLENGVAESGLESEAGIQWLFAIDVPAGATELSFTMVNGTGDADLYVRFGTEPTDSKYDCRPYKQGKDEVCEFEEVQEGRYYAVIDAYKAFSDTSLVASYKEGTPTPTPTPNPDLVMLENGVTESGLESEAGVQWLFAIDVPAGATELSFTMANGKGDADLYVRFGTEPTDSKYDCRPYKQGKDEVCEFDEVQEGRYYAVIDAYKAFSDTSLVASYNDGTPTPTPTSTPTPTPTSTPTPTPTAEPEACPYPGAGSSWEEIIEWMRCKNRRMS